jgi:hypothetical protein
MAYRHRSCSASIRYWGTISWTLAPDSIVKNAEQQIKSNNTTNNTTQQTTQHNNDNDNNSKQQK